MVCLNVAFTNSYAVAFFEELGTIRCGAIPMAILVQSVATPALARFGSQHLKEEFLQPTSNQNGRGTFLTPMKFEKVKKSSFILNSWQDTIYELKLKNKKLNYYFISI
jgi:hypothetical protein